MFFYTILSIHLFTSVYIHYIHGLLSKLTTLIICVKSNMQLYCHLCGIYYTELQMYRSSQQSTLQLTSYHMLKSTIIVSIHGSKT